MTKQTYKIERSETDASKWALYRVIDGVRQVYPIQMFTKRRFALKSYVDRLIEEKEEITTQFEAALEEMRQENSALKAAIVGSPTPGPTFFRWIADRMVDVYKEPDNVDFVVSLRKRADDMESALGD